MTKEERNIGRSLLLTAIAIILCLTVYGGAQPTFDHSFTRYDNGGYDTFKSEGFKWCFTNPPFDCIFATKYVSYWSDWQIGFATSKHTKYMFEWDKYSLNFEWYDSYLPGEEIP